MLHEVSGYLIVGLKKQMGAIGDLRLILPWQTNPLVSSIAYSGIETLVTMFGIVKVVSNVDYASFCQQSSLHDGNFHIA